MLERKGRKPQQQNCVSAAQHRTKRPYPCDVTSQILQAVHCHIWGLTYWSTISVPKFKEISYAFEEIKINALRKKLEWYQNLPFPVAARSKSWVCGCSLAGVAGSNRTVGMDGFWVLSVVRGLCVGPIIRPEESCREWYVLPERDSEPSLQRTPWPNWVPAKSWWGDGLKTRMTCFGHCKMGHGRFHAQVS